MWYCINILISYRSRLEMFTAIHTVCIINITRTKLYFTIKSQFMIRTSIFLNLYSIFIFEIEMSEQPKGISQNGFLCQVIIHDA